MLKTWQALYSVFSIAEKRRFFLLLVGASIIALLNVLGVASVMPFIAVAINPEIIDSNTYLKSAYSYFNFSDKQDFLIFLGIVAFAALLLSNSLTMLNAWASLKFWYEYEFRFSTRLFASYLQKPYTFFLQRNTAQLSRIVLSEVDRAVTNVIMESIDVFANALAAILLVALLIAINPVVALITVVVLGACYAIIFLLLKRRFRHLGDSYAADEAEMYRRTSEAFDGIKEVKLSGHEEQFLRKFTEPKYRSTRNSIEYDLLSLFPDAILETIAYGGIILLVVYLTSISFGSAESLSLVAVYAFAAYRMMPALQSVIDGLEKMNYTSAAVHSVLKDVAVESSSNQVKCIKSLQLNESIEFKNLAYRYPGADVDAIANCTAQFSAGSKTCITGGSGAGKSTIAELLLGLLDSTTGEISFDGNSLSKNNIRQWQCAIGYASERTFLTDDSIAENIAFGIETENIEMQKVVAASLIAGIDELSNKPLEDIVQMHIGEHGDKLSAGQRQRIGIARAIYRDPQILILDEATNALDIPAETHILQTLLAPASPTTVIVISHREWIAGMCDQALFLEGGQLHKINATVRPR